MSLYSQLSKNYETRLAQFLKRRTAPARKDVIPQTTIGASGGAVVQPSGGLATQLETKGDLLTFSDVEAILGVGTDTHILTADSAQALGIKWAAAAAIAHTDLSDMPSGSNTDHDARYYTQAEVEALIFWIRTGTVLSPKAPGDTLEIAQTSVSGNALKVTRNLASGSTDSPVVQITQDNVEDTQPALVILQDGSDPGIIVTANSSSGIQSTSATGKGVHGLSTHAPGVHGHSTNDFGVQGTTDSAANYVYGGAFDHTKVGLYADFDEGAAPASAPGNDVRVYALTGGLMYARDDGGVGIHKLSNIATVQNESANYTALTDDDVITMDASGGARTVDLYTGTGNVGREITIIKIDNSVNFVTIDGDGGDTINGSATYALKITGESVTLILTTSSTWWIK